jgi:hypothetical protein
MVDGMKFGQQLLLVGLKFIMAISLLLLVKGWYDDEQLNKGRSISLFLSKNLMQDVPPAEARWLEINANTYNVTIKEMEIFAK